MLYITPLFVYRHRPREYLYSVRQHMICTTPQWAMRAIHNTLEAHLTPETNTYTYADVFSVKIDTSTRRTRYIFRNLRTNETKTFLTILSVIKSMNNLLNLYHPEVREQIQRDYDQALSDYLRDGPVIQQTRYKQPEPTSSIFLEQ